MSGQVWHVLQDSGPIDREFAAALSEWETVKLWRPVRWGTRNAPLAEREVNSTASLTCDPGHPSLQRAHFTAPRGLSQLPVSLLGLWGERLRRTLLTHAEASTKPVLICTTSLFAGVAQRWPGPVVYWLTDYMAHYASLAHGRVLALDRQLCRRAALVCPNSERLAGYLVGEAGCAADKVLVLPNAARVSSLLPGPPAAPLPLPPPCAGLPRPVAGVIGNLGENTDWPFLLGTIEQTPWLTWLFVGPAEGRLGDSEAEAARQAVMRLERAHFVGSQPHAELARYARALDVAVLPYKRREPTFSGSSTRFYEHLAACHPMLATTGNAELLGREPLVHVVRSAGEAAAALRALRARHFDDGLRALRWQESQRHTWRVRAQTMRSVLAFRQNSV